jgi:hypothetical protein
LKRCELRFPMERVNVPRGCGAKINKSRLDGMDRGCREAKCSSSQSQSLVAPLSPMLAAPVLCDVKGCARLRTCSGCEPRFPMERVKVPRGCGAKINRSRLDGMDRGCREAKCSGSESQSLVAALSPILAAPVLGDVKGCGRLRTCSGSPCMFCDAGGCGELRPRSFEGTTGRSCGAFKTGPVHIILDLYLQDQGQTRPTLECNSPQKSSVGPRPRLLFWIGERGCLVWIWERGLSSNGLIFGLGGTR